MFRRSALTIWLVAIFIVFETGSVLAQSRSSTELKQPAFDSVWETYAQIAMASTCAPSSAPELQRQFDPVTGESTGDPAFSSGSTSYTFAAGSACAAARRH